MLMGWIRLILGIALIVLAALGVLGSVATNNYSEILAFLMMLAGGVWLIVSGRRSTGKAATARAAKAKRLRQQGGATQQCPNCGASETPDEENCCQYCGSKLN